MTVKFLAKVMLLLGGVQLYQLRDTLAGRAIIFSRVKSRVKKSRVKSRVKKSNGGCHGISREVSGVNAPRYQYSCEQLYRCDLWIRNFKDSIIFCYIF